MLEFNNVSRTFRGPEGTVSAVKDASFTVSPGELVVVQGASGSGKTTLLLMSGGLLKPSSGTVIVDGQNPYDLNPNRRSRMRAEKIGFVFQQFYLIPYLNVKDNILAPAGAASAGSDIKARASELISRFKLEHRARHMPSQLSTGERQRTALARALLNRPGIILADEPTGNLDEENAGIVLKYLSSCVDEGGAVLLVSHDVRTSKYATHVLSMDGGQIVG